MARNNFGKSAEIPRFSSFLGGLWQRTRLFCELACVSSSDKWRGPRPRTKITGRRGAPPSECLRIEGRSSHGIPVRSSVAVVDRFARHRDRVEIDGWPDAHASNPIRASHWRRTRAPRAPLAVSPSSISTITSRPELSAVCRQIRHRDRQLLRRLRWDRLLSGPQEQQRRREPDRRVGAVHILRRAVGSPGHCWQARPRPPSVYQGRNARREQASRRAGEYTRHE